MTDPEWVRTEEGELGGGLLRCLFFDLHRPPPPKNRWGLIKMGFFPMASSSPMHLVFDLGKEVGMG